ncbi:hypothetical protein [Nocardia sp. NPDC024068]|uniref:hypothetical protein n=1 Tax=Nocardia sp. NPDC024068 TaxID=3157197 RepID=UPI003401B497
MRPQAQFLRAGPRLIGTMVGAVALIFTAAPAVALPFGGNAFVAGQPGPQVELNQYCQAPGEVGHLADGETVYCTAINGSDSFVWSMWPEPQALPVDPNTGGYTCYGANCTFPDGNQVPEEQRCGTRCGEPPTTGDVQNGWADGLRNGASREVHTAE